jgi:hypothetical protein
MILIIIGLLILLYFYKDKIIENWLELPYVGNKYINNYVLNNNYPINLPSDTKYFNNIDNYKLSILKNTLNKILLESNNNKNIIFNVANQPVENIDIDNNKIKILTNLIIKLINNNIKIELIETLNINHKETDKQSKIYFIIKIKYYYDDYSKFYKKLNFDIIYIECEFIFEKNYDILPEEQFFNKNIIANYSTFISKLYIVGDENYGFLTGRTNNKNI